MCFFLYVICRYDFFAILHAFLDPWKAGNHAKPLEGLTKSRFHQFRKSMIPGCNLGPFGNHFGDLRAPKSHFFLIFRGFIVRFENHEFWNPKSIERYPGEGHQDLPDNTISKDLLSYLTRRIEARGQKAKCRRLGAGL